MLAMFWLLCGAIKTSGTKDCSSNCRTPCQTKDGLCVAKMNSAGEPDRCVGYKHGIWNGKTAFENQQYVNCMDVKQQYVNCTFYRFLKTKGSSVTPRAGWCLCAPRTLDKSRSICPTIPGIVLSHRCYGVLTPQLKLCTFLCAFEKTKQNKTKQNNTKAFA